MARKGGLGRGLGALIPESAQSGTTEGVLLVEVSSILPNPRQPREDMRDDKLQELADSIRVHGILQPLIVTQEAGIDQYILIAGERRLRAARLANLDSVPVIIRQVTDAERLELALIENIQRADLTPLETAEAYRQLNEDFGLSHDEIATRVGKNRTTITNNLRLLKLPQQVKDALLNSVITEGHARALLALPTPQAQTNALQTIIKNELNVRKTEELVRRLNGEKPPVLPRQPLPPEIRALEEKLRNQLGTKVNLTYGKKGGTLTIHYYSDEELNDIISHIIKEP
jgi:ParB family transcriptional regulator, chromosome partitioning protein